METLDRALAIKPSAYIYINRADVRRTSDAKGSLADLDEALKLEPDNEDALSGKAQMLADAQDYTGALALLDRIKPDPKDVYLREQRAILLYKTGRKDEAIKVFDSIRSDAKTATELNALCWNKATAGIMLDSALQDCRDALKLKPDVGAYLDSLGMVLLKLGKLDEALDAYNQAIAKDTGADSLMGRAFVYLRKGDAAHANADAAAARKISARIDDIFAEYGLKFDHPLAAAETTH
jgi:tetratricopeptide (TPR) repeat protein